MRFRIRLLMAVLVGFLGLLLVSGFAQEKKKKTYAKGDTVQVKYVGEVVTGKVVSAKISGFIEVEFNWKGTKMSKTFPLTLVVDSVAPVAPAAPPATPSPPATGTPQTGSGSKRPATAKPATKPTSPKPAEDAEAELRTWASDTGKFTIEARFGGLEGGKVKLLKPDGTILVVPLEKLSEADRELATQLASSAESPFMESPDEAGEDPFQASPEPATPQRAANSKNGPATPQPRKQVPSGKKPSPEPSEPLRDSSTPVVTTPVDWSGVRPPDRFPPPSTPPEPFQLEPDPGVETTLEVLDRPYVFATKTPSRKGKVPVLGFFESPRSLMMDPASNQAIVTLHDGPPGKPPVQRVIRIDLKDGALSGELFPSPVQVTAYEPSTRRFLAMSSRYIHPPDHQVEVFGMWRQGDAGFELLGAWNPVSNEFNVGHAPARVEFAGQDHAVLSYFPFREVAVWDVSAGVPQYVLPGSFFPTELAISANGKYLAAVGPDNYAHLLDLPTGRLLGKLPGKDIQVMAFDPTGRYIAAASDMRVMVYDLKEGRVHREIFLSRSLNIGPLGQAMFWLDADHLLVGAGFLIDLERSTILWHYELPHGGVAHVEPVYCGGRYWYVLPSDDREQLGLFGVQIPHPEALAAAETIDPNAMVLKPGAQIRLVLNTSATPEEQGRIKASLTKQIESQGMSVDDTSSLVLTGTTTVGQPAQQTYKFEGAPDQTVTSTPQIATVALSLGGEVLWKQESVIGGAIPFVISLEKGQSAQDYVNSLAKPNFEFFHHLEIPARLAKPAPGGAYGFSKLTPSGIQKSSPPGWW